VQKRGRIVNVASSAGLRGYAYTAAYCASKHALLGYTRAAARELAGSGVSIAAVCPHFVDSPLTEASVQRLVEKTRKSVAEAREFFAKQNPGGRLISTAEVADAIWSLIEADENGTILELDGARVLRLEGPVRDKA
jgi:NAD(P)-dependent dehydrogenase (short-subunit alcohol dehydrogenase family)